MVEIVFRTGLVLSLLASYRGELAALSAALIWAIASYVYIHLGKQLSPSLLNIAKSSISILLCLIAIPLVGDVAPELSIQAIALLMISGVIGIGLGDTVFFESLNCLGSRRALLLESLAPPLTALLALVFLQEQLSAIAWFGILLTVVGVTWVIVERTTDVVFQQARPMRGIVCGLLAALAQASGAVLSRSALAGSSISPLWSTLIRLSGGVMVLIVLIVLQRRVYRELPLLKSVRFVGVLAIASFFSTFLAIWLQQTAIKYTAAGIAQALTATSPLFVIPVALVLRESVSLRAVLGVIVAIVGIWLLFGQG